MSFLLGALSGGYQSQNSNSTSNTTQNQTGGQDTSNTYRPEQQSLQVDLANLFRSMLPGMASGTLSPNVQAQKTASADTINQNYSGLTDRVNKFLAQRGFGKSGTTGKMGLQTELSRQGELAGNEAKYAGVQDDQNSKFLSDALSSAYASTGSSMDWNSLLTALNKATGSSSGWGVGVGASGGGNL